MRKKVAVCDDSALVRSALVSFVESDDGLEVVGSYSTGVELVEASKRMHIDVVLLDVRMPGLDGPQTAALLRAARPQAAILYITSYPAEVPLRDALGGQVAGALTKDIPPPDLVHAIHLAANGLTVLPSSMLSRNSEVQILRRKSFPRTDTEKEVLELLCQGMSNDEISAKTYRSLSAVKHTISDMCRRAGVKSRTALVLYVLDSGSSTPS